MLIYPVLDLLDGAAVHAVGGVRNEYQPLISCGCSSACPLAITRQVTEHYGLAEWYMADLDGIVHRRWNYELAARLVETGIRLRIDWGIRQVEDVITMIGAMPACRTILCTETLQHRSAFDAICGMVDPRQITFSLDLIDGQLNCPADAWGSMSLTQIVEHVLSTGVTELLVLDVAYVGCERGLGTQAICEQLRDQFPELTLLTGGGIRSVADLRQLDAIGLDGVLLGSCLHQQLLTAEQLRPYCDVSASALTDSKISG